MPDERSVLCETAEHLAARHGFDSVLIIATKYDITARVSAIDTGTTGNLYAAYGSALEWVAGYEGGHYAPAEAATETDEGED